MASFYDSYDRLQQAVRNGLLAETVREEVAKRREAFNRGIDEAAAARRKIEREMWVPEELDSLEQLAFQCLRRGASIEDAIESCVDFLR